MSSQTMDKRPGSPSQNYSLVKKGKTDNNLSLLAGKSSVKETGLQKKVEPFLKYVTRFFLDPIYWIPRTSRLAAPIIHLTGGHEAEILSARFDPTGQYIASAGMDRNISLWNVYGECSNYGVLKGHKGAILEVQWNHDASQIYSACTDKSIGIWDAVTGELLKRLKGHTDLVNSVCPQLKFAGGAGVLLSASDDRTLKMWDVRNKNPVFSIDLDFPATATCFSQAGDVAFVGSLDDTIKAFDVRQQALAYTLEGHTDTVSGIRLSPDGSSLLSYSMDNTVRLWDVKPFSASDRCLKLFEGAPHGFEKNLIKPSWSHEGGYVATGGGDRAVTVWEVATGRLAYKLPGHKGCVNQVDFHPHEPILVSASTDRTLFMGEILPQ